ncbi:MarR family winged helix-turn-helix transcriptional regulator [Sulfurimonas sp.]|uniref:MarR family winged helix-turn-helix transcriptional regulator n=1 Tax=Sulfurimonas sp. TaxID=2022749 RepID=UPI003562FF99
MENNYVNQDLITNFYQKHSEGILPDISLMTIPITLIQKSIYGHAEDFLKEKFDMLHSEVNVLASLYTNGKVLSPTQLYDFTIFSSGGMTKLLKRLEARGYITRKPDTKDKRCMLVCLTDSGEETIKTILFDVSKECSSYFEVLDNQEKELLSSLLKKVLLNINKVECSIEKNKTKK